MSGGDKAQVIDVLRGMRARLDNGGWTQGAGARDCNGFAVDTEHKDACQWCLTGALRHEVLARSDDPHLNIRGAVQRAIKVQLDDMETMRDVESALVGIQWWNDNVTRRVGEVLELLDKTIKAEEARA